MSKHETKVILETLLRRMNLGTVTPGYYDYATSHLTEQPEAKRRYLRRADIPKFRRN